MATFALLTRLDARDRALFLRFTIGATRSHLIRAIWTLITHAGGVACSIAAAVIPLFAGGNLAIAARQAGTVPRSEPGRGAPARTAARGFGLPVARAALHDRGGMRR